MNEQEAIRLANTYSEKAGYAIAGLRANVVDPADRDHEIIFEVGSSDDQNTGEKHRVFVGGTGRFIGIRLADGTNPTCINPESLNRVKGEEITTSATRYLEAHDVDVELLRPVLLERPGLIEVWYQEDTDENLLGGWHTVFLLDNGDLLHIQKDQ